MQISRSSSGKGRESRDRYPLRVYRKVGNEEERNIYKTLTTSPSGVWTRAIGPAIADPGRLVVPQTHLLGLALRGLYHYLGDCSRSGHFLSRSLGLGAHLVVVSGLGFGWIHCGGHCCSSLLVDCLIVVAAEVVIASQTIVGLFGSWKPAEECSLDYRRHRDSCQLLPG